MPRIMDYELWSAVKLETFKLLEKLLECHTLRLSLFLSDFNHHLFRMHQKYDEIKVEHN